MPNIYEYLGYTFFFYSNDHAPRHVHVEKADKLMKVELEEANGIEIVRFKKIGNATVIPDIFLRLIIQLHSGNSWLN